MFATEGSMDQQCKDKKEERCVSRHIKAVKNDRNFDEILRGSEEAAWKAVILVVSNLTTPVHRQMVEQMLQACIRKGCSLLPKIHFFLTCI